MQMTFSYVISSENQKNPDKTYGQKSKEDSYPDKKLETC